MPSIAVKQINQTDLTTFVLNAASGAAFSGNLMGYIGGSGWFGPYVMTQSGGTFTGPVTFTTGIEVPYVGDTGSATNYLLVFNLLQSGLATNYAQVTGNVITISGNDVIGGYKSVTGRLSLAQAPQNLLDAVNLAFLTGVSGALAAGAGTATNAVNLIGNQIISGIKFFVSIPGSSGTPVNPTDLATKAYVDSATSSTVGAVTLTGLNQALVGTYNFSNTVSVPIATTSTQPVQLAQLQALGTTQGNISGFAGVLSINGSSGASGLIYLQSAGTVQVIQCGPIFYISGIVGNNLTQFYSQKIPLSNGVTGLQVLFSSGFSVNPVVVGNLEVTGTNPITFIASQIYNITTGGFNVAFQSGIVGTNYLYDFNAVPQVNSGQGGFFGLQGANGGLGPVINPRGIWQTAQSYAVYDLVYQPPYNASFLCTVGNVSTSFNAPGGTGNSNWTIYNSGAQGATGLWNAYYNYGTGQIFNYGNTTTYIGSLYGYTGIIPASGAIPSTGANWVQLAQQGAIGQLTISGIVTGNFVNMSFFLNPVNTGLNLAEAWVSKTFNMTGFALGCTSSGTGISIGGYPGPLSGDFYYRDLNNNKTVFQNFIFNSGVYSYISGGLATTITGMWRVGIDLTNTLGGIQNFSIGLFGFGYL
jgi:hypothetical protein